MSPEFDSDDQFFQAFKAGFLIGADVEDISDKAAWFLYCAWLEEDES